ncbi:MAG: GSU2403 family nucleotidyltransferase fold protein [Candidatus Omnitrophota bacterium]
MEKKMYKIAATVLKRLDRTGVLQSVVLIGSWSLYFYRYYFNSSNYSGYIRTYDMDFLVPIPVKMKGTVNILELIEDLGFVTQFVGRHGYVRLAHPDLIIEFLAPERGRGRTKPYEIPQLHVNAQTIRYLDFLLEHVITIQAEGIRLQVPHPAAYALHKFIIFKRRRNSDNGERDLEGALRVYRELVRGHKQKDMQRIFNSMHARWQKTVIRNLRAAGEDEIIELLA